MTSPRVLILDDDRQVRESLRRHLEDEGLSVQAASGIEQALASLERSPADVAVVDLRLAGASGETFILAARERFPGLRYLIYTASNAYQLTPALKSIGLTDSSVLHKPVPDLREISAAIRAAFAAQERPQ